MICDFALSLGLAANGEEGEGKGEERRERLEVFGSEQKAVEQNFSSPYLPPKTFLCAGVEGGYLSRFVVDFQRPRNREGTRRDFFSFTTPSPPPLPCQQPSGSNLDILEYRSRRPLAQKHVRESVSGERKESSERSDRVCVRSSTRTGRSASPQET